jgi:hypothetical protein
MNANGQAQNGSTDSEVLRWPGQVLTAEDLRRTLNGHHELIVTPRAIITPLASEELRTNGVRITRQTEEKRGTTPQAWGYGQDRPHPVIRSAVQSLERDGLALKELPANGDQAACRWARAVADCIGGGRCRSGIVFCQDPGLLCCVANKVPGLRAVAILTAAHAARAMLSLGANLVAVEMPGRTYFEVRQILRAVCHSESPACPPGAACILQELDGHAHR